MKKILFPLLTLVFIAGCGEIAIPPATLPSSVVNHSATATATGSFSNNTSTTNDTSDQNLSEVTDLSLDQKIFTISGLSLIIPQKYSLRKIEGNKVFIKTDDTEHNVSLVLEITSYGTWKKSEFVDEKQKPEIVLSNGELYRDIHVADSQFPQFIGHIADKTFKFDWDIASDEVAPKDYEDIWTPKTKVTTQDVIGIMKSVKLAN